VKLHKVIYGLSLTVCIVLPTISLAGIDDLDNYGQSSESVPSTAPTPEGLNRLFTTPDQRRRLDEARRFPPLPARIRFDGISQVKGKRRTRSVIWINGSTDYLDGSFTVQVNEDTSITVTLLLYRRSFVLLPGQTLDTVNQQVVEFYKE